MSNIIAISGKIGSGKSTLASFLFQELEQNGKKCEIKNFADNLKRICYILTGYYGYTQEEKNLYLSDWGKTVGEILQVIGTNAMREHFDKDVWVKSTLSKLKEDTVYIIGDCRFLNEVDAIKKKNGIVIRLNGDPSNIRKTSNRDLNHLSETALDDYDDFNFMFQNNKEIEDLKQFAKTVVKSII